MTPRERLNHILEHPNYRRSVVDPNHGSTSYDGHEDAAALRELDQLLTDTMKVLVDNGWEGDYMQPIMDRLKQAGY